MNSIAHTAAGYSPVTNVDLNKYSGKWYIIGSIPTRFDKKWRYTTESYELRDDGNIDVLTTYVKSDDDKTSTLMSKGFPDHDTNNVEWKVQFIWPFKADYLIEELADDYSYVVVGHPEKKHLYIMNRTGKMNEQLYTAIAERCAMKGYDITELRKTVQ